MAYLNGYHRMEDFSHRRLLHSTKSCSRYSLNTTSCMLRTGAGSSLPLAFSLLKKPEKLWGTMKRSPVGAIRNHLGARSSGFSSSSGQGQFQGDHENAARSLLGSAELMRKLRAPLLSLDSAKPLRRDIGRAGVQAWTGYAAPAMPVSNGSKYQ